MRARPARGHETLLGLRIAAAEPSYAQTTAAVRGEAPQPAAESVGLGLERSIASLQARVKQLESVEPPGDGTAEALREYGAAIKQRRQGADWTEHAVSLVRLQAAGGNLPQSTRTEIEAWARPAPTPIATRSRNVTIESIRAEAARVFPSRAAMPEPAGS